jgi:hypothetical protein
MTPANAKEFVNCIAAFLQLGSSSCIEPPPAERVDWGQLPSNTLGRLHSSERSPFRQARQLPLLGAAATELRHGLDQLQPPAGQAPYVEWALKEQPMDIFSAPHFRDDEAARNFLERTLWPDGPVCRHCGTVNHAYKTKRPGVLALLNQCRMLQKFVDTPSGNYGRHAALNSQFFAFTHWISNRLP